MTRTELKLEQELIAAENTYYAASAAYSDTRDGTEAEQQAALTAKDNAREELRTAMTTLFKAGETVNKPPKSQGVEDSAATVKLITEYQQQGWKRSVVTGKHSKTYRKLTKGNVATFINKTTAEVGTGHLFANSPAS